jgi:hypothetical protein
LMFNVLMLNRFTRGQFRRKPNNIHLGFGFGQR